MSVNTVNKVNLSIFAMVRFNALADNRRITSEVFIDKTRYLYDSNLDFDELSTSF